MSATIEIHTPYTTLLSKNARLKRGAGRRLYINSDALAAKENVEKQLRDAGGEWFDGPVWLALHVEKPRNSIDAINFVDTIADAASKAIGINDRWFSLGAVTWELCTRDPHITVRLWQETDEHLRYCMTCHRLLPLSEYQKLKSDLLGHQRRCRECHRLKFGLMKRVKDSLEADGYAVLSVLESGVAEYVAGKRGSPMLLVKVQPANRKKMTPEERAAFYLTASTLGALPVLYERGMLSPPLEPVPPIV